MIYMAYGKQRNRKNKNKVTKDVDQPTGTPRAQSSTSPSHVIATRTSTTPNTSGSGASEAPIASSMTSLSPASLESQGKLHTKRPMASYLLKRRSWMPQLTYWLPRQVLDWIRWIRNFVFAVYHLFTGIHWLDGVVSLIFLACFLFACWAAIEGLLNIFKGVAAQDADCSIVFVTIPGPIVTVSLVGQTPTDPNHGTYYYSVINGTTRWLDSIAPPTRTSILATTRPSFSPTAPPPGQPPTPGVPPSSPGSPSVTPSSVIVPPPVSVPGTPSTWSSPSAPSPTNMPLPPYGIPPDSLSAVPFMSPSGSPSSSSGVPPPSTTTTVPPGATYSSSPTSNSQAGQPPPSRPPPVILTSTLKGPGGTSTVVVTLSNVPNLPSSASESPASSTTTQGPSVPTTDPSTSSGSSNPPPTTSLLGSPGATLSTPVTPGFPSLSPTTQPSAPPDVSGTAPESSPIPSASTPPESTPPVSTPSESTPPASMPPESTPPESTPPVSTPSESTPSESTPSETTPSESTPSESMPSESTPHERMPPESTPSESTTSPPPTVPASSAQSVSPSMSSTGTTLESSSPSSLSSGVSRPTSGSSPTGSSPSVGPSSLSSVDSTQFTLFLPGPSTNTSPSMGPSATPSRSVSTSAVASSQASSTVTSLTSSRSEPLPSFETAVTTSGSNMTLTISSGFISSSTTSATTISVPSSKSTTVILTRTSTVPLSSPSVTTNTTITSLVVVPPSPPVFVNTTTTTTLNSTSSTTTSSLTSSSNDVSTVTSTPLFPSSGWNNTEPVEVTTAAMVTKVLAYADTEFSLAFPKPDITTTVSYWDGTYPSITGPDWTDLPLTTRTLRQTPLSGLPSLASELPSFELLSSLQTPLSGLPSLSSELSSFEMLSSLQTPPLSRPPISSSSSRRLTTLKTVIITTIIIGDEDEAAPTAMATRTETRAVAARAAEEDPGPTSCGESGNFTLTFDDSTVSGENSGVLPVGGMSPYHHLFYANGFVYLPDKWEPYAAVSQPNVAIFLPLGSSLLPNSAFAGTLLPGELGAGPRASVSAYWFNARSGFFGCALDGITPCALRISGYRYDNTLKSEVLVAEQNVTIPPCLGYINCKMSQVRFNNQFQALSGIQFNAYTYNLGIPLIFMMDDLQMEWYNNSCSAGVLRIGHSLGPGL